MSLAQAGQYYVEKKDIKASGVAKAQNKDSHYFFVEFETKYIAGDGKWVALPKEITRTLMFSLSEKALPFTEQKLDALEFDGNFANPGYGRTEPGFHVVCDHRPDNKNQGQVRENWDLLGWGESSERPEPDQAIVDQLTARWKHNREQAAPAVGKPATPPPPATPAQVASAAPATTQTPQSTPAPPLGSTPAGPPPAPPQTASSHDDEEDIPF